MTWSAQQYVAFEIERTRAVRDLLSAVPTLDVRTAIDLGCGPGNSTAALAARHPDAQIRGLDTSNDMLDAARKRLPGVAFENADVAQWQDAGPFDLILANAVLQWLPDHERLFPALMDKVAPDGTLAVQMPDNLDEPAHRSMRSIAADGPWSEKLAGVAKLRVARQPARWYYELLVPHAGRVDVWTSTYHHVLSGGASAVVEWFKGSGLRPFLDPLDEAERSAYLARYTEAIAEDYPALPDGTVLLPFPRLFIVATR